MQEMQETQVRALGQEDPLEKEMAPHPSILVGKGAWQATVHGDLKESDTAEHNTHCIAQRNLLSTLSWPMWEKNFKKAWICAYVQLIQFTIHLRLAQHCKSTILQ